MRNWKNKKRILGFTLLELMIVIAIMGVLATLISGNFITSLKKGRDARRKGDLEQIQRALEMYYEDNKSYPSSLKTSVDKMCHPSGCNTKIYMQKVPDDPSNNSGYQYRYCVSLTGDKYQIYSTLENTLDPHIITPGSAVGTCTPSTGCINNGSGSCKYGISSSNATP